MKWNPYANIKASPDTTIEYVSENELLIDGKSYEFDPESVEFPAVEENTNGLFLGAFRNEQGELHLEVRRFYTRSRLLWDTGAYHEIGR